jgi:hypothetical protein
VFQTVLCACTDADRTKITQKGRGFVLATRRSFVLSEWMSFAKVTSGTFSPDFTKTVPSARPSSAAIDHADREEAAPDD